MVVFYQIIESLKFSLRALKENLLRTLLSLLGVTVGIFAIILVLAAVDSLEKSVRANLNFLGSNVIYVERWPWDFVQNRDYPWWKYWQRPKATYQEFAFLEKNVKNCKVVAVSRSKGNTTLKNKASSVGEVGIQGISYNFNQISDLQVENGRYFTKQEMALGKDAIVLGYDVAENLFYNQSAVGKEVKWKGRKYKVIGIMSKQGNSMLQMGGAKPDLNCLIPYKSFNKSYTNTKRGPEPRIAIKGLDTDEGLLDLESELDGLMRQVRGLKPKEDNDFALNRPEMFTGALDNIFAMLALTGWFIGGFAMLVGGFGIANIMFVSVKERTNLIGIQKSLGAQNYFILTQFLFESIFLSLLGGLLGLAMVQGAVTAASNLGFLEMQMSISNISTGIFVSGIVGLFSGIIPAYLGSRLDPVIAIRSK